MKLPTWLKWTMGIGLPFIVLGALATGGVMAFGLVVLFANPFTWPLSGAILITAIAATATAGIAFAITSLLVATIATTFVIEKIAIAIAKKRKKKQLEDTFEQSTIPTDDLNAPTEKNTAESSEVVSALLSSHPPAKTEEKSTEAPKMGDEFQQETKRIMEDSFLGISGYLHPLGAKPDYFDHYKYFEEHDIQEMIDPEFEEIIKLDPMRGNLVKAKFYNKARSCYDNDTIKEFCLQQEKSALKAAQKANVDEKNNPNFKTALEDVDSKLDNLTYNNY